MGELVQIVIIDDNAGSLEMLSAALRQTGVSLHTTSDPTEGVELVRRLHPRLVITDLVMPGLSGLDVLDQVMSFDPSIDVLLMTALTQPRPRLKRFAAGLLIICKSRSKSPRFEPVWRN